MDLLKKEMERKRKALRAAKTAVGTSTRVTASALRQQQDKVEEELKRKESKKDSPFSEDEKKERANIAASLESSGVIDSSTQQAGSDGTDLKKEESNITTMAIVKKRLRSWGLPIRMFAELDADIRSRYEIASQWAAKREIANAEADEFRLHAGHEMRNRFLEKDATDGTPQRHNEETVDDTVEPRAKKPRIRPLDESIQNDPHKLIYRYLKNILVQWEYDLVARPEQEKQTVAGKKDTRTFQQCKDYIKPLFQLCKKRSIEPSMLSKLQSIIRFMQEDEFVKAHDAYMDLAIGRAAWPIGVTMVGIHARSGRAKIESSNVAHVMNSELQRKYLTSVKRLMTYQQDIRSDVAPSKKVG